MDHPDVHPSPAAQVFGEADRRGHTQATIERLEGRPEHGTGRTEDTK
jgi:hypothetical protein